MRSTPAGRLLGRAGAVCACALLALGSGRWMLPQGAAAAGPIVVTTTADAPDPTPNDSTCDTNLPGHPCSLRAAVETANHAAGGQTIDVPTGTFVLNATPDGVEPDSGDLEVTGTVTLTGSGQGRTIIDGNHTDRVLRVFNPNGAASLAMSGVTVQHGRLSGTECSSSNSGRGGGGILVRDRGTLSLSHVTVDGNETCLGSSLANPGSGAQGGGIEQLGAGSASITDSVVSNNRAMLAGGVSEADFADVGFPRPTAGTVTITRSSVTGNQAFSYAAGVDEDGSGTVTIVGSTIGHNAAHNDGSVRAYTGVGDVGGVSEDGGGTVDISGSTIDGNTSDNQGGGVVEDGGGTLRVRTTTISNNTAADSAAGMYLDGGGTVTIDTVQVLSNTVTGLEAKHNAFSGSGGGINEDGGDTVQITNSRISGNHSAYAAGILLDGGGTYTITDTTVDGNAALPLGDKAITEDGTGGGILNDGGGGLTLTNSTVHQNRAASGGGLVLFGSRSSRFSRQSLLNDTITANSATDPTSGGNVENQIVAATMTLKNTIVAGGSPVNCAGPLTSLGHNLDSGSSCKLTATGDISNRDPMLRPLASNPPGGPPTRIPQPGSPVIDAASGDCPPPATDERGVTRPQGPACDIGAVEFRAADVPPPPTAPPSPAPAVTPTPTAAPGAIGAPNTGAAPGGAGAGAVVAGGALLLALALAARRRSGRR